MVGYEVACTWSATYDSANGSAFEEDPRPAVTWRSTVWSNTDVAMSNRGVVSPGEDPLVGLSVDR